MVTLTTTCCPVTGLAGDKVTLVTSKSTPDGLPVAGGVNTQDGGVGVMGVGVIGVGVTVGVTGVLLDVVVSVATAVSPLLPVAVMVATSTCPPVLAGTDTFTTIALDSPGASVKLLGTTETVQLPVSVIVTSSELSPSLKTVWL